MLKVLLDKFFRELGNKILDNKNYKHRDILFYSNGFGIQGINIDETNKEFYLKFLEIPNNKYYYTIDKLNPPGKVVIDKEGIIEVIKKGKDLIYQGKNIKFSIHYSYLKSPNDVEVYIQQYNDKEELEGFIILAFKTKIEDILRLFGLILQGKEIDVNQILVDYLI